MSTSPRVAAPAGDALASERADDDEAEAVAVAEEEEGCGEVSEIRAKSFSFEMPRASVSCKAQGVKVRMGDSMHEKRVRRRSERGWTGVEAASHLQSLCEYLNLQR